MANKTAKEMFEELGYEIDYLSNECIEYSKYFSITNSNFKITFVVKEKRIEFSIDTNFVIDVEIGELRAINQQMKELGWVND